jgi:hypothetical protein
MPHLKISRSDLAQEPHDTMLRIVKAWKPEHPDHTGWKPKTEHDWAQSLFGHLQAVTDDVLVDKEKGFSGRGREDLTLDYKWALGKWHHAIEIKRGLRSSTKERDLKGQIENYQKKADFVHVVICGDDDEYESSSRFVRQLVDDISGFWKTKKPSVFWKMPDGSTKSILKP